MTPPRRRVATAARPCAAALVLLAAIAPASCHRKGEEVATGPMPRAAVAAEDLVATVDGRPISRDDVEVQAEAAHTDARTALEALIAAEAAAAVAEQRRLYEAPEVREATDQTLVRRYLKLVFEPSATPDKIPTDDLRKAFEKVRLQYDHPEVFETVHILAQKPAKEDAAHAAARRRLADEVAARARKVKSADEFKALATELQTPDQPLRYEEVPTARGWALAPEYIAGAVALQRAGDVSPVVETSFGYHVIYLLQRVPEEHKSFAEVEPELRKLYWPEFRRREFARQSDALVDQHAVQVFPGKLDEQSPR